MAAVLDVDQAPEHVLVLSVDELHSLFSRS